MEINPLGVLLAVLLIYFVFFLVAFLVVELMHQSGLLRHTGRAGRVFIALLAAVVLMAAAYFIRNSPSRTGIVRTTAAPIKTN